MTNPWLALAEQPHYVLAADSPLLDALGPDKRNLIKTHLLPAPWIGPKEPRLIVLLLNPGYKPHDDQQQGPGTEFYKQQRLALAFSCRTPFYQLDPAFSATGAYAWYFRRLRRLITDCGLTAVQQGVMFMQYFPYRSTTANFRVPRVPSLDYSLQLLRCAMQRDVPVLVARSKGLWFEALPELAAYPRLSSLRNPRSPYLTPGNLGATHYESVFRALAN